MADLRNIKDYIKSLSRADLHELKVAVELEIYLAGLRIQCNKEPA